MDESYQDEPSSAALVTTSSYKIDPNWYSDTGATNHITSDLGHLVVRKQYHGGEQVQVSKGAGLQMLHTSHSSINTYAHPLTFRIFCMCLKFSNIFFPFINFSMIMMYSLNNILGIFLLRIDGRGKSYRQEV